MMFCRYPVTIYSSPLFVTHQLYLNLLHSAVLKYQVKPFFKLNAIIEGGGGSGRGLGNSIDWSEWWPVFVWCQASSAATKQSELLLHLTRGKSIMNLMLVLPKEAGQRFSFLLLSTVLHLTFQSSVMKCTISAFPHSDSFVIYIGPWNQSFLWALLSRNSKLYCHTELQPKRAFIRVIFVNFDL